MAPNNVTPLRAASKYMLDTLANLVTGLGFAARDKGVSDQFVINELSQQQLEQAYRGDWMVRKIVDIIPFDQLREGWCWKADEDAITAIEASEKRLKIDIKLLQALTRARLYGGAGIYVGIKGQKSDEPLDPETVGRGMIEYLHVLTRHDLTADELDLDLTSPMFGEPKMYRMQTTGTLSEVVIHPSRFFRFSGAPLPNSINTQGNEFWGDSILLAIFDAVKNAASSQQHVAALLPEAKVDVVKVPGLSEALSTADGTTKVTKRFTSAAQIKSMFGMLLLEGDGENGEQWEQKQINFQQFPDLLRQFMQVGAGAADIPVTRLLGQAPAGLNATGDNDTRNYYDMCVARRKVEVQPQTDVLFDLVIRDATGKRDPEIYYEWHPLWQLTAKEKSDIAKSQAEVDTAYVDNGLIPQPVLAIAVRNRVIETGIYPGIEQAYEDMDAGLLDPQVDPNTGEDLQAGAVDPETGEPLDPPAANNNDPAKKAANDTALNDVLTTKGRKVLTRLRKQYGAKKGKQVFYAMIEKGTLTGAHKVIDAEPMSLYVCRPVLNADDIKAWAKKQGIDPTVAANDMHVTIAFSRTPVDWFQFGSSSWGEDNGKLTIPQGGPRAVVRFGTAVVLQFASSNLKWRWQEFKDGGASWDYNEYNPHITLSWQVPDSIDLTKIEPYTGKIELGPELFKQVQEDWKGSIIEDHRAALIDRKFV